MSNTYPLHVRVARRYYKASYGDEAPEYLTRGGVRPKTAGEIRFIKDTGPEQREIPKDFEFDVKYIKSLSRVLWGLSCAMGHMVSAHSKFTKIKAVNVSPDGKLGGKGYIQSIQDMRKSISEAIETMSNCVDTIHDEIKAPHWASGIAKLPVEDQVEVENVMQDSEDILADPEAFSDQNYEQSSSK